MAAVNLPNGDTLMVPDSFNQDQVNAAVQSHFAQQAQEAQRQQGSTLDQMVRGGVDSERNTATGLLNMASQGGARAATSFLQPLAGMVPNGQATLDRLNQGFNIQPVQTGEGTAYSLANKGTDLATNIAAGAVAPELSGAAKLADSIGTIANTLKAPTWLGAIAKSVPGMAAKTAGGALTGAAQNSDDPITGAITGAGEASLPDIAKSGYDLAKYLTGKPLQQQILSTLGGAKNLEENGKELASNIYDSLDKNVKDIQRDYYNPVFDKYGNASIYPSDNVPTSYIAAMLKQKGMSPQQLIDKIPLNPEMISQMKNSDYLMTDPGIYNKNPNLQQLHNQFMDDPSLQNAHILQSDLGKAIGDIAGQKSRGSITGTQEMQLQNYGIAQKALQNDMGSFLKQTNPAAANLYNQGTQNWLEKVIPYYSDKNLASMATGEITNPENSTIQKIFTNPEDNPDKPASRIANVARDLGPNGQARILYSALGMSKNDPQALAKAYAELPDKGFGSYTNPQADSLAKSLSQIVKWQPSYWIKKAIPGGKYVP